MDRTAIIFDMDGVLIDSEELQAESDRLVFQESGIILPQGTDWSEFKGRSNRETFVHIIDAFSDGSVTVSELIDRKQKKFMEISHDRLGLIAGVERTLPVLRKKMQKIALVTSSGRAIQEFVFDLFHFNRYFDAVTTGDDVQNGKPHPEPYMSALEKLSIQPEMAYVVEDSGNGVLSAKAAGCSVIGITTSFPREVLLEKGADFVVDSFEEITALVVER